ncbi:MAG: 3-isopropylmalate dehydratase large subunit [Deltaproteobacteria bacterium]|nr:3-isopropylmalate dehydratase large subunit [Deltaproteobacteria bacterium]
MAKTLLDKIWDSHFVGRDDSGKSLIYIDRHLVHEVTSPQAFEGLKLAGRKLRRPDLTFATIDHNVPTTGLPEIKDSVSKTQINTLEQNCQDFSVPLFGMDSDKRGIVHVIGPELGLTLPGQTIVCGDSHTATHGAFGSLAFGIGTSEVEHVMATQCLWMHKPKNFLVRFEGELPKSVSSKDMILYLIRKIGTSGGTGHVFEFAGSAISSLSMEARMSLCNMSIEAGARAGLIAPDQITFDYLKQNRPYAPKGEQWEQALSYWKDFYSDQEARFDSEITIDVSKLEPQVSWGTNPGMVLGVNDCIPEHDQVSHCSAEDAKRACDYMGVKPGQKISDLSVDVVFIGSCTNSRIEDLRVAAQIFSGKKVKESVRTLVVPGSQAVKEQAEKEGLHKVFTAAGAEWRESGCSMCLAMNPDKLKAGERCASTSNRNFEGRQGVGGRTHLVSPQMAAAAAIHGHFIDVRDL